ncbi:hypothetical protein [Nocardioides nanhaiensis]|uniref:Peptidase MA-like domain-containing protein n=1 Tax=Nocardioides nanhaiensis TaxID=1476871 RepID=A0ABP8WW93_9ACTN
MAGLSLFLVLAVAGAAWVLTRPEDPYTAQAPAPVATGPQAGEAAAALDRLVEAVQSGDVEAAEALADPDDAQAVAQLGALAQNGAELQVEGLELRYVDEVTGVAAGRWSAAVDAAWAFGGFDPDPARTEVLVGFRATADDLWITSVGGGDRRTPIWMTGPLTVDRTEDALVLVAGSPGSVDAYARAARAAVPVVRRVLPQWRTGLVVEVAADLDQLGAALDVEPADYEGIAALATSPDGTLAPQAPVHVFLNREVYDQLGPTESQVVMSHEATHVATSAPSSLAPAWLVEGIADFVALRDVDLPDTVTAGQIIREVRRQGLPEALPSSADFDSTSTYLGSVYEAAWLVCRVLAERGDQEALVRLYDDASRSGRLQPELRELFGWSEEQLVDAWQAELERLTA